MSNERSPRDVCSITIGIRGLIGRSPVYERGGVWGTGRFPTLSERRGYAGETWFPPRSFAERERCSCRLLAAGGPQLRVGFGLFLVRGPELLSRLRDLRGDRLDVGGEPVECRPQAQVLADRLLLAMRPDVRDELIRFLARVLGLLPQVRLDLGVRDLDPGTLRERLERELARDGD